MFRRILRSLDVHILSRLPARMQLLIKRTLIDVARLLAPGSVPEHVPDGALIRYREPHRKSQQFPEWAIDEIESISSDCGEELHAEHYRSRTIHCHHTPFHRAVAGHSYRKIADSMPIQTSAILICGDLGDSRNIAPWHARALSETNGRSLTVLMTEGRREYLERLGQGLQLTIIDMEAATSVLHHAPHDRLMVLTHLILQMRPTMAHVIGSRLGYDMIQHYSRQLSVHSRLFVSSPTCDWDDALASAVSRQTVAADIICHSSSAADRLRPNLGDRQGRLHIVHPPSLGGAPCNPLLQEGEEWQRFKDGVARITGYLRQHGADVSRTASQVAASAESDDQGEVY
jgi:hypothetical protein